MIKGKGKLLTFSFLCAIIFSIILISQTVGAVDTEYDYAVPHIYQLNYKPIGWSCCGPASITMLLCYHFPNSEINVPEVYHSGTQAYNYHGPAIGYKSVSFVKEDHGSPHEINEEFENYYSGDNSGMYSGAAAHYLNLIWGGNAEARDSPISDVINEIKNRPLILNVWYYWYDVFGNEHCSGHYVVLRGYNDKGTPELEDDLFHINDPAKEEPSYWSYKEFSERRYKGRIIAFDPVLKENQRKYTVIVDNANVLLDDIGAKDDEGKYIWWEYYGLCDGSHHGDWYYSKQNGHWAKWIPNLSLKGNYEVHVIFRKDQEQGNVKYTINDSDGNEIDHKIINQEGTDWSDEILGIFSLKKGFYVQAVDMPAKCNADAIRFEYILSLCIITPTQSSPASAGAYDNPSHIDVKVEVKEGENPITGLTNADFSFKIGEKSATASLTDDSTPGRYVFDVTPPHQDAAGKYDFEVTLTYNGCTFGDREEEAVIYTAKGAHADVMLIIDRSGSMEWPTPDKMEDAKNSAKLFVDYMRYGDKAGVVSFGDSASYNYFLDTLDADIKWAIKNAIDSITAGGMTAMGEGLRYGLNNLNTLGDPTHAWAMVLLSDGYQNQGEHPDTVLPDIKASNIKVFTIGLGDDVDKALLEHIATETGGKYYHAATSDQLREIYESIVGKVVGWQTILEQLSQIFKDQIQHIFAPIEDAFEAIFSISWGGSDLDLVLYKPDGTKIDPTVAATDPNIEYVEEATYEFYRVTDPDPGQWTMEVTGVDVPPEGEEFTASVKAISTLNLYLSTDKDKYNQDEVIKTIASITEGGLPLTGATVNADITMPDGSTESLSLYDDGGHGDVAPNDGVYANYFTNTGQTGTYKIDAAATGTTPSGASFSRLAWTSVEVVAGQSVITLIPDTWNETVNASEKIEKTFNVSDPPTVGEKFIINKDLYAEYNGTHYLVYKESSIGGEPDYILSALPTTGKSFAADQVSKWVLLTPTSLETPTGDLIDASNIILTPCTVQVPLNGSEEFNVSINIPADAISGVYSGKIVATTIGGSDCIDLEITVIGTEEPGIKIKKTSSPNPVAPGGTVTYTINYTNSGGIDLTNVTITEKYPKGMTFISADPAPDAGTNNKWTVGTLSAGASGQIIIKLKVPEARDLSFTESGSVTGEGFVMINKDISTEQKPYSLKNVVTLSCAELSSVSASAFTTVSGVPGTSLEITEHGSGIYSSDEILNLQTKNKSIMLQKSTEAEYQPTYFLFSDGFAVNFATRWMQDICAKNIIMGDAMHKKIKDASYIKDETIAEVGKYRTSMEFESSFYGAAHIGTVSKSTKTSEDYIGAFEITWAGREECTYLFNWSRVPGNDSEKLIQFLVDVLDLDWAENATITKSVDEMSINITDDGNTATITIDANKETATVKVGGETIYSLEVRIEDDTLNIYDCKLEKMEESVRGIGYVMLDKNLASGQMQVREHGSGIYSSDLNFESGRLDKVTEAEYQPTSFNFSDGFDVNFSSKWVQSICAKDKKAGTAIHKKISDAAFMVDDTTATKSSMEFESSFNGSMHIGARTDGTRISEDYIGVFNITELIKIGKPAISTPSTPTPDWLPCPFPKPAVSTPPSDLHGPSSDP